MNLSNKIESMKNTARKKFTEDFKKDRIVNKKERKQKRDKARNNKSILRSF